MSKIKKLLLTYEAYIQLPWRLDSASEQRVVFCVYDQNDELRLRAKLDEFDISTKKANHGWHLFDLTDTFAVWLAKNRYAKSYFSQPEIVRTLTGTYLSYLVAEYQRFLQEHGCGENDVVALSGVASLFGMLKVKELVDQVAKLTKGRLVVFFPGTLENNNYKLLNAYDGWNYLAVPITAETKM